MKNEWTGENEKTHADEAVALDLVHPQEHKVPISRKELFDRRVGEGADKPLDVQRVGF